MSDQETTWLDRLNAEATPATAAVYRKRSQWKPAVGPRFLNAAELTTLAAVIDRLVPQSGERVAIASVIDVRRAEDFGNGWRPEVLPPDDIALRRGLANLNATAKQKHGKPFADLAADVQDTLLAAVQRGDVHWPDLPATPWFGELLGEAVEIYVSHPRTLAAMAFTGVMIGPRLTAHGQTSPQAEGKR